MNLLRGIGREGIVFVRVELRLDRQPGQSPQTRQQRNTPFPLRERGCTMQPDRGGDQDQALRRCLAALERVQRKIQCQRRTGGVTDHVQGLAVEAGAQVLGGHLHHRRHVFPFDVEQSRRRRAVAGQAQTDDPVAFPSEGFADCAEAVR